MIPYASFQGIQYAQSPVGDLRFKAPLPYHPMGIYDVSNKSLDIMCPQIYLFNDSQSLLGQEDCLFLNVYVPQTALNGVPLPVLFWIHGGGLGGLQILYFQLLAVESRDLSRAEKVILFCQAE